MLLKTQWGLKNGAGGTRPTCHVLSECPCTALPGCQQSRHQLLGDDSPLPLQKSIQWHETRCKLVFSVHKYEESLYEVLNISLLSNFTHLPHFKKRKSTINVTSSTCFLLTVSSMTRRLWSFKRDCGILHIHAHTLTHLSHCLPVSPAGTLCRHVSRQAWKHQWQNISEDTQIEVTFLRTEVNRTCRNQRIFPDLSL